MPGIPRCFGRRIALIRKKVPIEQSNRERIKRTGRTNATRLANWHGGRSSCDFSFLSTRAVQISPKLTNLS